MENNLIKDLIEQHINHKLVVVDGDGYHYKITVVSDDFEGLSRVHRTQKIYQVLNQHIKSGELHALSIKPYTIKEWELQNG